MLIRVFLLLIILAGAYFGFLRDRFVSYPINTTLTNKDGVSIPAKITSRSPSSVQFEKRGQSTLYTFEIEDLSLFSQAKLKILPVSPGAEEALSNNESVREAEFPD